MIFIRVDYNRCLKNNKITKCTVFKGWEGEELRQNVNHKGEDDGLNFGHFLIT